MILVISPAKSLNFDKQNIITTYTKIAFPKKTEQLINKLKKLTAKDIGELMKLSAKLSDLNYERFQQFSTQFNTNNAKQAILAFTGDVYKGMDAQNFTPQELNFAQNHVRILSGLYGILKPLDLIQPYRLEMSTKFTASAKEKNLYEFWKETTTQHLSKELNGDVLLNLASNEYFKSIDTKKLKTDVLTINFKENKNGQYKNIAIYAKKARGFMTNYIVKNKINAIDELRGFDYEGYAFNNNLSKDLDWVFTRG